jgi:hypothetical protein
MPAASSSAPRRRLRAVLPDRLHSSAGTRRASSKRPREVSAARRRRAAPRGRALLEGYEPSAASPLSVK